MRQVKLERDAHDEERRRQEHERLLVTTSVAEQPFLFLADELVLLIFSSLSARELCLVSRVCKRFSSVAKEDKLWEALCQKKWGTLKEKDIFNRDNKVSWKVTFKNNWHKEVTKAKRLARIPNPIPCRYCGETTASTESRQRNVQYLQWIECVSCGERWGWSMETGDLRGLLSP